MVWSAGFVFPVKNIQGNGALSRDGGVIVPSILLHLQLHLYQMFYVGIYDTPFPVQ